MRNGDKPGSIPEGTIVTRRLMLREQQERDRAALDRLAAAAAIAANLWGRPGCALVVLDRHNATVIGVTGYGPMADRPGALEVATFIAEDFQGRGYATEATQAMVDRAFCDTGSTVLWTSIRVANQRAKRVVEKCGFQFRETGMARTPASRGAVPVERYVLDRRNWASLKSWGAPGREEAPNAA